MADPSIATLPKNACSVFATFPRYVFAVDLIQCVVIVGLAPIAETAKFRYGASSEV